MSIQIPTVADGEETQTLASYTLSTEEVQAGVTCYLSGSTPVPVTTTNRLPIVLSDSQMTTLTPPAAITGFATSAKQDEAKTVLEAARDRIGATDETSATSDTATSGLNGLFKRLLAQFTVALARLPSALVNGRLAVEVGNTITETNSGSINGKLPALAGGKLDIRPLTGGTDTVSVNGSVAVTGTFWQSTQPVVAGSYAATPSASFNRPADTTAYASGDLVANSTTAGSVTPMSFTVARVAAGSGFIRRARLIKSGTSTTNASFRLHLYVSSPSVTNGDNGAWLTPRSGYLGAMDLTIDRAFSDASQGLGVPVSGSEMSFVLASGTAIFGLLEARAAYTPSSGETFTVELEVHQN